MGFVSFVWVKGGNGDFVCEFLKGGLEFGVVENVFGDGTGVSGDVGFVLKICNDGGVVGEIPHA